MKYEQIKSEWDIVLKKIQSRGMIATLALHCVLSDENDDPNSFHLTLPEKYAGIASLQIKKRLADFASKTLDKKKEIIITIEKLSPKI